MTSRLTKSDVTTEVRRHGCSADFVHENCYRNIDLVRRSIVRYVTRKFSDAETAHVRDRRHFHIETYTFGSTYRHSTRLSRTISRSVVVGWTRPKGREQLPMSHLYTSSQSCLKSLSLSLRRCLCLTRCLICWFSVVWCIDIRHSWTSYVIDANVLYLDLLQHWTNVDHSLESWGSVNRLQPKSNISSLFDYIHSWL